MYELYALFPFEQVEKNSRVIIYGAGRAGLNFWRQAGQNGYCNIICLVDKDEKKHNSAVKGLEVLQDINSYDFVVISQINFAVRRRIKDDLISYGVPEEKIILPSDNNLMYWSLDGMMQSSLSGIKERESDLVKMDARNLVSADRLDIGIKWLLVRDIMNNVDNPANKSLYTRHIMAWTQGKEGFMPSSGRIKDGVQEYIDEARKIIEDIKANGFDKSHAVPLSSDNEPLDGIHRIASCIEADEPVWIKRCPGLKPEIKLYYKWYMENGFDTDDLLRIYRAYCDLYKGAFGIVVLFGPALDLWNYLLQQLERQFKLVGYVDLNFESNYIAYENLINEMYFYKWVYKSDEINHKISLLKLAPLKLRVIVLSDENSKENFYGKLKEFKLNMREATFFDFDDIELQIHSSDNEEEANHLAKVLLSPNNLNVIRHRFNNNYRKEFIDNIVKIKKIIMEAGVPLDEILVVNSMVLEALGIRNARDIDVMCRQENKGRLTENGLDTSSWPYYCENINRLLTDDNCYFIFNGMKFLNINFIKEKKQKEGNEKDKRDIRLIDLYNEMTMVYDERKELKQGIFEEIKRRRMN